MPRHTKAEDGPAGGPVEVSGWPRREWRLLRRWERPRRVTAGITAGTFVVVLAAANGMIGAGAAWAAWWTVPAIAAGALLAGLVVGSYVRAPIGAEATVCDTRWPVLGLAGLALGTSPGPDSLLGYLFSWASPAVLGAVIQPAAALASRALLGWALRLRLDLEQAALTPAGEASPGGEACTHCRPLFPAETSKHTL